MKTFTASVLLLIATFAAGGCQHTHVWGQKNSGSPLHGGVNVNVPLGSGK